MEPLSSAGKLAPKYILGNANIDQKVVDSAVDYLKSELSEFYAKVVEQGIEFMDWRSGLLIIPKYLVELNEDRNNRYYAGTNFKIKRLKPDNSLAILLLSLSQRISDLGFPSKHVEVRFEKGCYNAVANFWHRDFTMNENVNYFSVCYSNVEDWNTKILDEEGAKVIGEIPQVIDQQTSEKIESLAKNSEFGLIYEVTKVLHRSPLRKDFQLHAAKEDYRLFIRFHYKRLNSI